MKFSPGERGRDDRPGGGESAAGIGLFAAILLCLAAGLLGGCADTSVPDRGAHQSLVEIGELSLEQAETLEANGRIPEANIAYRRSLWAFKYHQRLTTEQPFLMEEAEDGVERTSGR